MADIDPSIPLSGIYERPMLPFERRWYEYKAPNRDWRTVQREWSEQDVLSLRRKWYLFDGLKYYGPVGLHFVEALL